MTARRLAWLVLGLLVALPQVASAHRLAYSKATWTLDPATGLVEAALDLDVLEVEAAVDRRLPALPAERRAFREAHHAAILGALLAGIAVEDAGRVCPGEPVALDSREDEDILIARLRWTCAVGQGASTFASFAVRLDFLSKLRSDHKHLVRFGNGGKTLLRALSAADPAFRHDFSAAAPATPAAAEPPAATFAPETPPSDAPTGFGAFFLEGLAHIAFGWDHLLFLLALLAVGGTLGGLVRVVTAFTVAHSVTLVAATLDLVSLDAGFVEATIAASIVYVAAENLLRLDTASLSRSRWALTFAFGLIHGFGFAGFLRELDLPPGDLAAPLVAFNLGVEAGQLALVALAWPLLRWAQSRPWHRPRFVVPISGLVAAAGCYWLWERTVGS